MSLHELISTGGKVLVVGGYNKSWREYRNHPQLEFWTGDDSTKIYERVKRGIYPEPLKAVLVSRFISHNCLNPILAEARRKQAVIFAPLADGQLRKKLEEIVGPKQEIKRDLVPLKESFNKPRIVTETNVVQEQKVEEKEINMTPESKKTIAAKGQIKSFVQKYQEAGNSTTNEAKRLLVIAGELGIKTTQGSLEQAVRIYRKQNNISSPRANGWDTRRKNQSKTETKQVAKSSGKNTLLELIDEAITAMKLVRDEVKKLDNQSSDYLKLKNKLAALLE